MGISSSAEKTDQYPNDQNDSKKSNTQSSVKSMSINNSNNPTDYLSRNYDDETMIPTVFKWEHGGKNVYISGTFNNWEKQLPMHKSGNDFSIILNLKKGIYAYKYIVDDEWRFSNDQVINI